MKQIIPERTSGRVVQVSSDDILLLLKEAKPAIESYGGGKFSFDEEGVSMSAKNETADFNQRLPGKAEKQEVQIDKNGDIILVMPIKTDSGRKS